MLEFTYGWFLEVRILQRTLPTVLPHPRANHDSDSLNNNAPPPLPRFITPSDFNDSIPHISSTQLPIEQDSQSHSCSEPAFSVDKSEPSIINSTDAPIVTRSGHQVTKNPRYFNDMHANSAYLDTFFPDEAVSEGASLLQLGHDSS